jgi:Flp pilus assembly pilin Flp
MLAYVTTWLQLKTDCRGVTAIEYGIMAALIGTVLVTAVAFLTGGLTSAFTTIGSDL